MTQNNESIMAYGSILEGLFIVTIEFYNGTIRKYENITKFVSSVTTSHRTNSFTLIMDGKEININYKYVMSITIEK